MDSQLLKLQKTELEILDEFVRVCDVLGLQYFFECGSVLGAIRHKGFIPWDDDIDVAMMRNEYNIFLEQAPKLLNEKYYLESDISEPDNDGLFAKLRNKRTVFDEGSKKKCNGIFIDIFPHDLLPDDEYLRKRVIKKAQILRWLHVIQSTKKRKIAKGRTMKWKLRELMLRLFHPLLLLFPHNFFKRKMAQYVIQWNKKDSHWLTCHYDADPIQMNIDEFFPLQKVMFCGKEYNIMKNYDEYLTQVYGDYMVLPPENSRITHMPKRIKFED